MKRSGDKHHRMAGEPCGACSIQRNHACDVHKRLNLSRHFLQESNHLWWLSAREVQVVGGKGRFQGRTNVIDRELLALSSFNGHCLVQSGLDGFLPNVRKHLCRLKENCQSRTLKSKYKSEENTSIDSRFEKQFFVRESL